MKQSFWIISFVLNCIKIPSGYALMQQINEEKSPLCIMIKSLTFETKNTNYHVSVQSPNSPVQQSRVIGIGWSGFDEILDL